jgi:hypothetical protein
MAEGYMAAFVELVPSGNSYVEAPADAVETGLFGSDFDFCSGITSGTDVSVPSHAISEQTLRRLQHAPHLHGPPVSDRALGFWKQHTRAS